MPDNQSIRPLQSVGGTLVATRPQAQGMGQEILVEATPLGERLAWLLASLDGGGAPKRERLHDRQFYVVRHSRHLDDQVTELIDALIGLRVAHPRLVQLELDLTGAEVAHEP